MPRDFKNLFMSVDTISGKFNRDYYLELEGLFYLYMKYQCDFKNKELLEVVKTMYDLPHMKEHKRLRRVQRLDAELCQRYRVGCVYYICEKDNLNIVKIGYTYNLPERLNQLQCAHYKQLIVKEYYFTQFPQYEEQRLHKLYKSFHIRGEWYRL
jgi:hypothetical protein